MIRLYPENQTTNTTQQPTGKIRLYKDTQTTQPPAPLPASSTVNIGLPGLNGNRTSTPTTTPYESIGLGEAKKVALEVPKQAITELGMATERTLRSFETGATPAEKASNILKQYGAAAGVLFSPITAIFSAADKIPELKPAVDIINLPFTVTGKVGEFAGDKFTDVLPISKEAKDTLRPALKETGSLLGQIILGGKVMDMIGKGMTVNKKVIDTAVKETKIEAPKEIKLVPKATPITQEATKLGVSGEKGIIPQELQPLAQEASKYKNAEEFVKAKEVFYHGTSKEAAQAIENSGFKLGSSEISPLSKKSEPVYLTKNITDAQTFAGKNGTVIEVYAEKGAVKLGLDKIDYEAVDPSKLYTKSQITDFYNQAVDAELKGGAVKGGEVKAIPPTTEFQSRVYDRMKQEYPQLEGELSYNPIKLKEDAQRAVDLISKDKQKAYDIAMGKEVSPDITSTAVNIALSEKALAEGNNTLFANLIKNRSLAQTRRGQELVSEKGSITDNSISRYVKELISSRLDKLGQTYLSDLKGTVKKQSTKESAIKKIDSEVAILEMNIKGKKLDVKTALSLLDKITCV